jgi:hypothetical protein
MISRPKYAGTYVVDENVDFAEFFNCWCDCSIDGIVVAYVGYLVDDFAACIGSLQFLLQCDQLTLMIVSQWLSYINVVDYVALNHTSVLDTKTRVAPSAANAVAQASPIPIEAPVWGLHN